MTEREKNVNSFDSFFRCALSGREERRKGKRGRGKALSQIPQRSREKRKRAVRHLLISSILKLKEGKGRKKGGEEGLAILILRNPVQGKKRKRGGGGVPSVFAWASRLICTACPGKKKGGVRQSPAALRPVAVA